MQSAKTRENMSTKIQSYSFLANTSQLTTKWESFQVATGVSFFLQEASKKTK